MYSFRAKFSAQGITHTDLLVRLQTRIGTQKLGNCAWKLVVGHKIIWPAHIQAWFCIFYRCILMKVPEILPWFILVIEWILTFKKEYKLNIYWNLLQVQKDKCRCRVIFLPSHLQAHSINIKCCLRNDTIYLFCERNFNNCTFQNIKESTFF